MGIGVGYLKKGVGPPGPSRAPRFEGLGSPGEEDSSNGGSKEAGRFLDGVRTVEERGGRLGSPAPVSSTGLIGEEFIFLSLQHQKACQDSKEVGVVDRYVTCFVVVQGDIARCSRDTSRR